MNYGTEEITVNFILKIIETLRKYFLMHAYIQINIFTHVFP